MIKIDENGNVEDYKIILCKRNHDVIGELVVERDSVVSKVCMNAANELSFKVYKYIKDKNSDETDKITPCWKDITDFKYVYVPELDEYYEITVEEGEDSVEYKSITATSACEVELANTVLYDFEINTEEDIARDDYTSPTIFYSELEPKNSLLHRVLYKLPQYSIKHVDNSLMKIQRTFSEDGTDVYSFLTETVAEEVGCLFTFDSTDRTISAYDLKNVCIDCGYRGEYTDVCPKCGSTNLKYYGEDTTIYIDDENLAQTITHTVDTESLKNCFKLRGGDDNMTAAIVNSNPNGSDYIYYFSDESKSDMSDELIAKIDAYDKLEKSYEDEYTKLMAELYEDIDKIVYYTSGMMPKQKDDPTDAKKEGAKLTAENLSPLGMTELKSSTSVNTVNNAMEQYAKVFIKSGYFKAKVDQATFSMTGVLEDGTQYGTWIGNFIVTNYSDDDDTYTTPTITVTVNDKYYDFISQKVEKKLKDEDESKDGSIFDVLSIKELDDYKDAITYYGLNRLKSFADAFQGALDIMIESDQANSNAELYEELYIPYYDKLTATNEEIDKRSATIDEYTTKLETGEKRQREIQKALNFQNYLGEDLYNEFLLFRREQEYSNDNYISDGLENNELFEKAQEFLETARDELYKSGEKQHKIETSLINLLAIPEFEPLKEHFKLGNFIRIKFDDQIYKLRLLSYQITFGEGIGNIDVELSDVSKIRTGTSDLQSIIKQASTIGSTYNAMQSQMKKVNESDALIRNFVNNGLDATTMKIVNNSANQNMVIGDSGLLMRRKEDFSELYSDYQLRIINNGLYITKDNWRSTEACIGQYVHVNPETGKQEIGYGVLAKNLVGQLILGNQLGIYSEDGTKEMSFDNYGLKLNVKKNETTEQYTRLLDIQRDGESQLWIDEDGNVVLKTDQVIQMTDSIDRLVSEYADIEKLYVKSATLENLLTKYAKIDDLEAFKGEFKELVATDAEIEYIKAGGVTITGLLKSQDAEIENIKATKVDTSTLEAYKATITELLTTYATIEYLNANYIKTDEIDATYAKISELEANYATIEKLNAATADINKLIAKKADVEDLNAVTAQIETLNTELANVKTLVADKVDAEYVKAQIAESEQTITKQLDAINATIETLDTKYATIEQLNAAKANLEDLIAKKASIEDLDAAKADIGELDALVANIDNILAGNIGTGTLQTIHLTANNVVIDDAIIKSANIEGLDVSKLNAGTISTDKFAIQSDDGGILISGSTQQFKDKNGKVRLQIGQDAQGNFNFIVFGEDGTTAIYNQDGITKQAVPDGLIVDDMVADDANIQAKKIQYVDTEGNKTLQTVIEQEQGKISELIKETTIDNGDGTTSQLKDKYLETVKTVDGIKTTVADIETTTDSLSTKVTEIETTVDGVKTTVTEAKTDAESAKTIAEQASNKFSWIVKSGSSESDFLLTDRTAELVADNINLNGLVTFNGLNSDLQNRVNKSSRNLLLNTKTLSEHSFNDISGTYMGCRIGKIYKTSDTYQDCLAFNSSQQVTSNAPIIGQDYTLTVYAKAKMYTTFVGSPTFDLFNVIQATLSTAYSATESTIKAKYSTYGSASSLDTWTTFTNYSSMTVGSTVQINAIASDTSKTWHLYFVIASISGSTVKGYYLFIGTPDTSVIMRSYWYPNVYGNSQGDSYTDNTYTSEWKRYEVHWNPSSKCTATDVSNILVCRAMSGRGTIYLSAPKFELGNKATDWTPALEDAASQSIIDNWAKDATVNGETTINGGYVKTNTIKTDQLAVDDIFATGSAVMNIINAQEINANRITSGSISAERLDVYGLTVTNKTNQQQTFNISNSGEVTMRGSVSSYNYIENIAGWAIYNDGTAFFNNVTARGSVITGDGGIASSGGAGRNIARDTSNIWGDWFAPTASAYHTSKVFGDIVLPTYEDDEFPECFTISFDLENTAFTAGGGTLSLKAYLIDKNTYSNGKLNVTGTTSAATQLSDGTYKLTLNSKNKVVSSTLYTDPTMVQVFDFSSTCTTAHVTHYSKQITLDKSISEYYLVIVGDYSNGTGQVRMKCLKVESGNYETDWSLAPEDSAKQVRFWAGSTYDERETAPFIVYNDGTIKATQGEFSGVFSGTVKIGNIEITDPSAQAGNDALLTIRNGQNGIKRVQLTDTAASNFAQNINITDNTYSTMITLDQSGYGTFKGGITVGNVKIGGRSLLINNNELTYNTDGFSTNSKLTIGNANQMSKLRVYGDIESENMTVDSILNFGSVLKFTKKYNGLNIDFIE